MRDDVSWLYRSLSEQGLIVGSSGNVSGRSPDGGMVITPSGGDPATAFSLVDCSMEGAVSRGGGTPSSEWALHAAVYRECPEARFIIHTHADACTALACLNQGLPAFHYMVVQFGGADVRCARYVTFGTVELAAEAAEAIRGRSACLLANHGMIVCAGSAKVALGRAVLLETLCRQYLLACSAGVPRLLSEEEMAAAKDRFRTYGPR